MLCFSKKRTPSRQPCCHSDSGSISYLRMLRKDHCKNILTQKRGSLAIVLERVACDYHGRKRGVPQTLNAYRGEYMTQYSHSEITYGALKAMGRLNL